MEAFTAVSYRETPVEEATTHCFRRGQIRNGTKTIDIAIPLKVEGRKFSFLAEDAVLALPPITLNETGLKVVYQFRFSGNKKLVRKLLTIEGGELRMNAEELNGKEMTISLEKKKTLGFSRCLISGKWRRKYLPQILSFRLACLDPTAGGKAQAIDEIRVNLRLEPVELCDIQDPDVLEKVPLYIISS